MDTSCCFTAAISSARSVAPLPRPTRAAPLLPSPTVGTASLPLPDEPLLVLVAASLRGGGGVEATGAANEPAGGWGACSSPAGCLGADREPAGGSGADREPAGPAGAESWP